MDALREYLAWQAELGGDEVMVASPLPLRTAASAPAAVRAGTVPGNVPPGTPTPPRHETGSRAPAGPANPSAGTEASLFAMLSQSLQDSQDNARAARRPVFPPAAAPSDVPVDQAAGTASRAVSTGAAAKPDSLLPPLPDLAACREYLERNGRTLFTGDVQDASWTYVHGTGPRSAPLAIVGLEAAIADGAAGQPFQGPAGQLLEKMMRAIRLDLASLYRTLVVKLPAPGPGRRCYTRRDLVRLLPLFHAELEAAGTPVALLLGEACAQAVLKTGRGLEELRLAPHRVDGFPGREFAVTYHPDELEGNEDLKRKAWKDLQWLQARLRGG